MRTNPPVGKCWDQYERDRDPKLKGKGTLVCKFRHNLYVVDDPEELERRVAEGFPRNLIVLTPRLECDEVSGCEGSKSYWAFNSLRKEDAKVYKNGQVQESKVKIEMQFMPCFCRKCQKIEEIKSWEREHERPFLGPKPLCAFHDDIASTTLPERPADVDNNATHLHRAQIGICTVTPHNRIADANLYAYISPKKNDGTEYVRTVNELKMQCRCRSITVSGNKNALVRKLMGHLEREGLLPNNAEWPPLPAAPAEPNPQALPAPENLAPPAVHLVAAALAAADANGHDDEE